MSRVNNDDALSRRRAILFSTRLISAGFRLFKSAIFRPRNPSQTSFEFCELYSQLWDTAEHSISHSGFSLPTALGDQPANRINRLLSTLYGGLFSSLSFSGSSGALITILTAVLPKLHRDRDIILYDDVCHQSALGGILYGRWKAMRLQRDIHPDINVARPVSYETVKSAIETCGAKSVAAILLVSPSYDGFTSPAEHRKIFELAKALDITVIIDGAWDSMRFRDFRPAVPALDMLCDIWISSPHKRGLTPSSLGCMVTSNERIAELWDEAQDLGFRSSSISFVDMMIAEHRLQQVIDGAWDATFKKTEDCADLLREFISTLHPLVSVVNPRGVDAERGVGAHILITTHRLPEFDARQWANSLATEFGFDVEKASRSTILLICGSPTHLDQLDTIKSILKISFENTLRQESGTHD